MQPDGRSPSHQGGPHKQGTAALSGVTNGCQEALLLDFPGGPVVKHPPCNAKDTALIPDLGRSHMPRGN